MGADPKNQTQVLESILDSNYSDRKYRQSAGAGFYKVYLSFLV